MLSGSGAVPKTTALVAGFDNVAMVGDDVGRENPHSGGHYCKRIYTHKGVRGLPIITAFRIRAVCLIGEVFHLKLRTEP